MINAVLLQFLVVFFGLTFIQCNSTSDAQEEFVTTFNGTWKCVYTVGMSGRHWVEDAKPYALRVQQPLMSIEIEEGKYDDGWYKTEATIDKYYGQLIRFHSLLGVIVKENQADTIIHDFFYFIAFEGDTLVVRTGPDIDHQSTSGFVRVGG